MEPHGWQIPRRHLLRLRYGLQRQFQVLGRCVGQNEVGLLFEPEDEIQTFSEYRAVRQFIPYDSVIELEVMTALEEEAAEEGRRQRSARQDLVRRELTEMLGPERDEAPPTPPE